MDRILRPTSSGLVAALAILSFLSPICAATQSYCSSQNTATGDSFFWTFQSNGKCTEYCNSLGRYAFAVIQYTDCWCSNYIPATQDDLSNCQVGCPGYPDEGCGNMDEDLYVYVKLNNKPSGTATPSQASSSAVASSTRAPSSTKVTSSSAPATPSSASSSEVSTSRHTPTPVTVIKTVIGSVLTTTVTPSSALASTTLSTRPSSTLETVKSSVTRDQTSLQIVTESGSIITRTLVLAPVLAPSDVSDSEKSDDGKSNIAAIVGGVVGGVAGIAILIGLIIFFLWRRKRQQAQDEHSPANITRNTSTMSKAGLLGGKMENGTQYPPMINTRFGSQNSRLDSESASPGSGRRYSQPLVFDSRLNPTQLMVFDNSSRGSIDDSHDYGRRLGVANPDPPAAT